MRWRKFCGWLLRKLGWTAVEPLPEEKKCIMLGVPHSSVWDFVISYLYFKSIGGDGLCILRMLHETGYSVLLPSREEMTLEEPEIVKQSGRYGVRLRANAPSVHMMKTTIKTEITPIVGSEQQSEELVNYLLRAFEEDPSKIWESNIFGKSLHELVSEGLHNKLYRMPADARGKLKETMERIINDGCNGLICIIL